MATHFRTVHCPSVHYGFCTALHTKHHGAIVAIAEKLMNHAKSVPKSEEGFHLLRFSSESDMVVWAVLGKVVRSPHTCYFVMHGVESDEPIAKTNPWIFRERSLPITLRTLLDNQSMRFEIAGLYELAVALVPARAAWRVLDVQYSCPNEGHCVVSSLDSSVELGLATDKRAKQSPDDLSEAFAALSQATASALLALLAFSALDAESLPYPEAGMVEQDDDAIDAIARLRRLEAHADIVDKAVLETRLICELCGPTLGGNSWIKRGNNIFDSTGNDQLGEFIAFGYATMSLAVKCKLSGHCKDCKRSASMNKYGDAESVLVDRLYAGRPYDSKEPRAHKDLPRASPSADH